MAASNGARGFWPFDVDPAHIIYTVLGLFTVIFGLFSMFIKERLYLGEAPIATVTGIILGPRVLGWVDPASWGDGKQDTLDYITLEVTRVVIALGVFSVGVELPKAYMKRHWLTLFFLLIPCMVYGWLISALVIWGLVPGLTYLSAMVIAACVTPTDPILAQAVVGGKFAEKHVPTHIRHMLSAESGCNDGAAFPFLYIALYLTLDKSTGHAVGEWFYMTWLYEVALGILIGAVLGWGARKIMQFSERRRLIDRQSYVAQYVSLAILSIGVCTLLGSDDLLAAFACGSAFAWDGHFNKATEDAVFSNVIDLLFNVAAFIYIGAIIPFGDYNKFHLSVWRLIVIAIVILIVRRMPVILALYKWIPDIKTFREALFVGWFGPMGVGAVFIATLARHHVPEPEADGDTSQVDLLQETIFPVVSILVLASVVTHGMSIPFFVSGRRVHSVTTTWSRAPSMADNQPAWTTHATRLNHGQDIVINRDDEAGDIGLQHRPNNLSLQREKSIAFEDETSGSGSGSSATRAVAFEKPPREQEQAPTDAETASASHVPINAYREGHDLVVERHDPETGDVLVDRQRDVFPAGDRAHHIAGHMRRRNSSTPSTNASIGTAASISNSNTSRRRRPSLRMHRTRSGASAHSTNASTTGSMLSIAPASDQGDGFVRRGGAGAEPATSYGPSAVDYAHAHAQPLASRPTPDSDSEHSTNASDNEPDDADGFVRRRPYAWTTSTASGRDGGVSSAVQASPAVHSHIPASRIRRDTAGEKGAGGGGGGWRRFLRVGTGSSGQSGGSHAAAEEGRSEGVGVGGGMGSGFVAPRNRSVDVDVSGERGIPMTRTVSRAVSFAPDAAGDSETAPGQQSGNYGSAAPGFRRNPGLGMSRTRSIGWEDEVGDGDGDGEEGEGRDEVGEVGGGRGGVRGGGGGQGRARAGSAARMMGMFRRQEARQEPSVSFQEPRRP